MAPTARRLLLTRVRHGAADTKKGSGTMIYARNELKLGDRVGLFGPSVVVVLALIAIVMLARDAMG